MVQSPTNVMTEAGLMLMLSKKSIRRPDAFMGYVSSSLFDDIKVPLLLAAFHFSLQHHGKSNEAIASATNHPSPLNSLTARGKQICEENHIDESDTCICMRVLDRSTCKLWVARVGGKNRVGYGRFRRSPKKSQALR